MLNMHWKKIVMAVLCAIASLPLMAQVVDFTRQEKSHTVDALHCARFLDDHTLVFAGRSTGGVHFLNLKKLVLTQRLSVLQGCVDEFAIAPDRKGMIITTFENEIGYYDLAQGKLRHQVGRYYPDYSTGKSLTFSPDGKCFGTFLGCNIILWDKGTGLRADSLIPTPDECLYEVAYGADGNQVYGGGNKHIWMYDRRSQTFGKKLPLIDKSVMTCIRMRPDHRQLAVATRESMYLYDTELNLIHDLKGQETWVNAITYSPDGKRIYACSGSYDNQDYVVRAWDTETGAFIGTLQGHTDEVDAIDISPNGKWIVTASMDGTMKIWRAAQMELVLTIIPVIPSHDMALLCFTPDGHFFGTPVAPAEGTFTKGGKPLSPEITTSKQARRALRKATGKIG